jgi:hypothetical protein
MNPMEVPVSDGLPPYNEQEVCRLIDRFSEVTDDAQVGDALLAHATMVSGLLHHYPGGVTEAVKIFMRLLKDCLKGRRKHGPITLLASRYRQ